MYVTVILPLPLRELLSYHVPPIMESQVHVGCRVAVELGGRKVHSGLVIECHDGEADGLSLRPIASVIDPSPVMTSRQIELWRWIADYYMCSLGEVMLHFLPASMKLELLKDTADELFSLTPGTIGSRRFSQLSKRHDAEPVTGTLPTLTDAQDEAVTLIRKSFDNRRPVLLHGVSGAGKTEIYMHLIAETIQNGGTALLLIPELALSTQLVDRLSAHFANTMTLYNSRSTPATRQAVYNTILHGAGGSLIVGTRSVVALPFEKLDLIVIDEEQDAGYRQTDPAPRYNARDAAIMLGHIHKAKTLLSTATPSVESYHNAMTGKYNIVTLPVRYNGKRNPKVTVIDRRLIAVKEKREHGYNADTRYLSQYLIRRLGETIAAGEQAILFQNRRGYSSRMECMECGHTPECPHCNVTLTYHKAKARLECHYCGHSVPAPMQCPACGRYTLTTEGIGTENIEEKIAAFLPQACIVRLDADITRSKRTLKETLRKISSHEADIIIGTQMISKGFDFDNIGLVGIINADNLLCFPDFRAAERTFQLLVQTAGRMCRGKSRGELIIQSSHDIGRIVGDVINFDYLSMYNREIGDRLRYIYPPFSRIISITLKHHDLARLEESARHLADECRRLFGNRAGDVAIPMIDRIREQWLRSVTVKIERGANLSRAKSMLRKSLDTLSATHLKGIRISINADL